MSLIPSKRTGCFSGRLSLSDIFGSPKNIFVLGSFRDLNNNFTFMFIQLPVILVMIYNFFLHKTGSSSNFMSCLLVIIIYRYQVLSNFC